MGKGLLTYVESRIDRLEIVFSQQGESTDAEVGVETIRDGIGIFGQASSDGVLSGQYKLSQCTCVQQLQGTKYL